MESFLPVSAGHFHKMHDWYVQTAISLRVIVQSMWNTNGCGQFVVKLKEGTAAQETLTLTRKHRELINHFTRRNASKLGEEQWRFFCESLTSFTSITKIWVLVRYLRYPVVQQRLFNALVVLRGVSQTAIGN